MSLATYFRRCDVTQFHTQGCDSYDGRRRIQERIDRLRDSADTPEKVEIFLAWMTAAASRYPGSVVSAAIPYLTPDDFNIGPPDMEALPEKGWDYGL